MIDDADSGAFEQIIVYKFDRFARNRVDSIMYKAQLKSATASGLFPQPNT